MSCSLTVPAVRDQVKTVTRRRPETWRTLAPGDRLTLIEKGMGLAAGEKQVVLADVVVVSNRLEPLSRVTPDEVMAEGLWTYCADLSRFSGGAVSPARAFVEFWLTSHGYPATADPVDVEVRRIEWDYVP